MVLLTSAAQMSSAQQVERVPFQRLGELTVSLQGLQLNNFNFLIEEALFGGIKATAQCTGKNTSNFNLNYTVYIAAFDAKDSLIACFGLEPMMNIHEEGKVETLEASGMVEPAARGEVSYVLVKVVLQSPSD